MQLRSAAITVLFVIIAFSFAEVHAQPRDPNLPIKLHDADGDGKISPQEWPLPNFRIVDKNNDGFLTQDDFAKHWGLPTLGADTSDLPTTAGAPSQALKSTASSEPRICPSGAAIKWIDTHVHVPGRRGHQVDVPGAVQAARDVMDGSSICRMVLMPTPKVSGTFPPQVLEDFLDEARRYPEHFVVMGGGGTLNPMIHDDSGDGHVDANLETRFVERSAKIIKLGAVGYGEVAVLHLAPYRGQQFELVNGDHPLFLKLADITARHDVVIDVHFDMVVEDMETPEWLPQPLNPPRLKRNLVAFERFLSHNRNARIVWAHLGSDFVGFRTPKRMRRMLRDHPNLYMSLRLGPGRVRSNHPIGRTGIKGPWMRLFQDFPDRFVIGTDQIFSIAGGSLSNQHAKQRRVVRERTNTFLSYLPNDLARKIAHENAMRIYKITM